MLTKLTRLYNLFKIRKFRTISGWLTYNEALALFKISKNLPPKATVVEIGSWQGKSTYCIAKGLSSGKLFAIDPFNADGGFDKSSSKDYKEMAANINLMTNFTRNLSRFVKAGKVIVKKGYSFEYADDFEQIDFLFIDGDHSIEGCKRDFTLYEKRLKTGGILALHDYNPLRKELGPTFVVEEVIANSKDFQHLDTYDSLWVAKKIR